VRLPNGQSIERNTWQVRDAQQLTSAKLAQTLSRERVKESTLDFANRRHLDGESVFHRWVERGRAKIETLASRAAKALKHAKEKFGITANVSAQVAQSAEAQASEARAAVALSRDKSETAPVPVRRSIAEFAADAKRTQAQIQETPKSQNPGESDELAFRQLIDTKTGERAGLAARLSARLEQSDEQLSKVYREHLAKKPEPPRGLAALLGRSKFETAHGAWQQRTKQIEKRISDVQKRLKTARNARGRLEALRLATAKAKHAQPELSQRVELHRTAKLFLQKIVERDTNRTKTIERTGHDPGRSR